MVDDLGDHTTHNVLHGDVTGQSVMAGTINGDVHLHPHSRPMVALPHRAGISPPRAGSFQKRQTALSADTETRTIVLTGLGGVGKTQLALDHSEGAWAAGEVDLLVWVTADSRDAVVSTYANLAADLTGVEDADPERGAGRLWEWLASTTARWLVVLDDVTRPGDLRGLWPPRTTNGRTVVTTRRTDAAIRGDGRKLIEIGVFTPSESKSYLMGVLADHTHLMHEAAELGEDLKHLPLALAQASAYMIDRELSCADYRTRFADRRRKLATLFPDREHLPDGHQRTVAATWSLSVELADQLVPAGLARPLLMVASLLDPNGIPLEVFAAGSVLRWLELMSGRVVSTEESYDGLSCLHRLSLISFAMSASGRAVRVHGLVQRATQDELTPEQLEDLVHANAKALLEVWPPEFHDAVIGQSLRANTDALEAATHGLLWQCSCRDLIFKAAISLGHSGRAVAAHNKFRRLTATVLNVLGPDDPSAFEARQYLARWTGEAGLPEQAVVQLESLLPDVTRVMGSSDRVTLDVRNDLAHWRGQAGDPDGALSGFTALLPDQISTLGHDERATLITRSNIARFLGESGNPRASVVAYEKLMPDLQRVLGRDHVVTLTAAHNHAHWRGVDGDPRGAIAGLRAALADRERVLGSDHPHTFSTRGTLARWRGWSGDPTGAAHDLSALLADRVRVFGDHPETVGMMDEIADLWRLAGDPVKAMAMYEAMLDVVERTPCPDSALKDALLAEITECRDSCAVPSSTGRSPSGTRNTAP